MRQALGGCNNPHNSRSQAAKPNANPSSKPHGWLPSSQSVPQPNNIPTSTQATKLPATASPCVGLACGAVPLLGGFGGEFGVFGIESLLQYIVLHGAFYLLAIDKNCRRTLYAEHVLGNFLPA
jgi:hypothetical protein